MIGVTEEAIQLLLDRRTRDGMIVSCYADTCAGPAARSPWSRHLRIEARAIEQRLSGLARARFNEDVQIIREALAEAAPEGARAIAVFSAAKQRLLQIFLLNLPVGDRLVLGRQPYLVPLLQALHRREDASRAHDRSLRDEFVRRLRDGGDAAAGPREVLQALYNGYVARPGYLLLEPDRGTLGSRCEQCGYMSTTIRTRCPVCRGMCDEVNLWQEILLFAARHHITAHTVEPNGCLAARGGIGAVLSRCEPWEAAAPSAAAAG